MADKNEKRNDGTDPSVAAPAHVDPHDLVNVRSAPTQPISDSVRVRILKEQESHTSQPNRYYIPSGAETDLPKDWAKELLDRGEAEPIAQKGVERMEKRPAQSQVETRDAQPETKQDTAPQENK